jgi:hypothetical protein
MAYLRKQTIGSGTYYYICESRRVKGKVTTRVLEYLGRDPDEKRLNRALKYWRVKKGGA